MRRWGIPGDAFEPIAWPALGSRLRAELGCLDGVEESDLVELGAEVATFVSQSDPFVGPQRGDPELMEGWAALSSREFISVDVFHGDHFYLMDRNLRGAVAEAVARRAQAIADLLEYCGDDTL